MNLDKLLQSNMIAAVTSSPAQIKAVLMLAERDIKIANDNFQRGYSDWALNIGYNAMLQAGRALMLSGGYKPIGEAKHVSVIEYVKSEYSSIVSPKILKIFSQTRAKRHRAVYEEANTISEQEARTVIYAAEKFVAAAKKVLQS